MENKKMSMFILIIFLCLPLNTHQRNSEILILPDDLVPIHYDLSIITDLKNGEEIFWGTLNLKVMLFSNLEKLELKL